MLTALQYAYQSENDQCSEIKSKVREPEFVVKFYSGLEINLWRIDHKTSFKLFLVWTFQYGYSLLTKVRNEQFNHLLTTMAFISRMAFFSFSVDPLMYRLLSMTFRAAPVLVSILLNFSRPFPITWPINCSGIIMSSFLNPPWLEVPSSRALYKATQTSVYLSSLEGIQPKFIESVLGRSLYTTLQKSMSYLWYFNCYIESAQMD